MTIAMQALQARAAVLSLLCHPNDEARAGWLKFAPSSAEAWDFFLRVERCALIVRAKLHEYGLMGNTNSDVIAQINARATFELQRALSARAQLQRIANIAGARDWKVVVLKGGALLADGGHIDLHDLDVLMLPDTGISLAHLLDGAGYSARDPLDRHPNHHWSPRYTNDSVAIEIHHSIKGMSDPEALLDRAVPCAANAPFWRLSPVDHLWHLLIHSAIQHPDRRGTIRDSYLIAHGITSCSSDDRQTIATRIAAHHHADALSAVFHLAQAIGSTHPISDPFLDLALRKYVLLARYRGRDSNLHRRTLRFVCGDISIVQSLREDLSLPRRAPSQFTFLNTMNHKVPWLAPAVRQIARLGRLGLVAGLAAQNAWETRRVKRQWLRTNMSSSLA